MSPGQDKYHKRSQVLWLLIMRELSQTLGLEDQPLSAAQPQSCWASLLIASLLSLSPTPCSPFLCLPGKPPEKAPSSREPHVGHFYVGSPALPFDPTAITTPFGTRYPGIQLPTIQQTDPHHHTGFIGPESHTINPQGALLPLTPKSVQRP